ncbi:MAG: hypothetical protein EXR37_06100 [Limnohabitans sp.]|nr:hypothetical protein [Limnohabitans sp.]
MKTLRYFITCLLAVSLPLQALAALLPATCRHSSADLSAHADPVMPQPTANHPHGPADMHSHTQAMTRATPQQHSDTPHKHSHQHGDKHRHIPVAADSHENMHTPVLVDATLTAAHSEQHAAAHDNCCHHGVSCCAGAAMLPFLPGLNPPLLSQSRSVWDVPVLLPVPPRTFDHPPKPVAA